MPRLVIRYQGWLFTSLGLIVVLTVLLIPAVQDDRLTMQWTLLAFGQTIGIALFGFGLIGVLLETRNWREYFGERLREIVLTQAYLDRIEPDTLKALQVRIMKALFRDPDIDREGSFLNYFNHSLHRYISEPYREDVSSEMTVEEVGEDAVTILDRVTYTCRRAGDSIQEAVKWGPDPDEWMNVSHLRISVQFPQHHPRAGDWENLEERTGPEDLSQARFPLTVSLERYRDVDRLRVQVEARYQVKHDHFQYWQMAHPTRSFEFSLAHPASQEVQIKPFVLHPKMCHISNMERLVRVKYDSWMLPKSGVAWLIRKRVVDEGTANEASLN